MSNILHVFPDSLFTSGFLELVKTDKNNTHKFILMDIGAHTNFNNKKYDKYIVDRVSTFNFFDFIKLKKLIKNPIYDKIIIHSGYLNYLILSFVFNKKVMNKSILSLWGGSDAKKFTVTEENKRYKIFAFFYELIRRSVYKKFKVILSIVPDDYNQIKKIYNLKAENYPSVYPFIPNVKRNKKSKEDVIKVQICHSGSIDCNTLEVLDKLKIYKDENILIYASVGYGNDAYIEKIIDKGKSIFKDKFIYNKSLMSFEEYNKYISSLDVLINNSTIQQGLGNINLAFFNGIKVFLSNKGKNMQTYKEKKLYFSAIEDIDKLKFKDFYKIDENNNKSNMNNKFILSFFNNDNALKIWREVFDKEM